MNDHDLLAACQQKMETNALRAGQGDVIRHLQNHKPCLAIIPTGGGKSLLWLLTTHIHNLQFTRADASQRPLTLVIVPYKALVIDRLRESDRWFRCLSSENSMFEMTEYIDTCSVIYSTPEKIVKNIAFQQLLVLNAIRIRIIAIDEAHLLLEHAGFRPDLCACIELLHRHVPRAVRLAVTSTSKISDSRLLLEAAKMPSDSQIVRCSFDRSNCFISIAPQMDKKDNHKLTKFTNDHISIFQLVNTASKPQAVVFVCSKKEAENLALHLQNLCSSTHLQAHEIVYFHSELLFAKKQEIMSGFASRSIHVVVSTSAFGAGVNFPCIRYIIHYGLPSSLTEYMHTISQGGRDGLPYRCAMYFSHKNIHEQIAAWMHEANVEELLHKWRKFVEIIKFVLSPKCRRALILPFFDSSYDCDSMCNSCDACALCDEEEVQIDIQAVARILLKVIREFQLSSPGGVMFSRVKDVITSHGVATKIRMDSDAGLISRGIAAKSGFPVKNKAIWSIAVNYMLYGDIPFLCENVVGVGNVNPMLLRKLVLTEAGSAWLERSSQGSVSSLYIRHPVELLHFPHSTAQAMFFPDRSMSAQSNISVQVCTETRACKIEMCERPVKAHGLCQKHYMAVRRAAAPKSSCNEANLLPQPSHSAANNGTDNAFTSPRILSPILSSPSTVLRPQPQRALPSFGSRLPESHLQYLQRPQACFRHEFFSSSSDEDKQDRFTVFGHLVQHGSSFDHEQMHGAGEGHFYSGFTEFNASNRVNRHDDCLRQVAGAEAVETGIHPLITRVQNAITQKMPVSLDEMECDADLRSAVGVQEHLITRQSNFLQNTKKPKSIQSSQFVGCSHAHFNTRNHFEMRQKISREGLSPGKIVEVHHTEQTKARWYMRITDGRVQGHPDDPYLVGAQWLKANSRSSPELPIQNRACHIKTIIAIFDASFPL